MSDIDRDALNRELLHRLSLHPKITIAQADVLRLDYCTNLNAIVDALNALKLDWAYYPVYLSVHVMERHWEGANRQVKTCQAADTTPAALATAFVQAALKVLGEEETGDLG